MTEMQTSLSAETCPHCGKRKKTGTYSLLGHKRTILIACPCEEREWAKQERIMQETQRQRDFDRRFRQSNLGEKFAHARIDAFEPREGAEKAFEMAKRFIDSWPKSQGFLLLGKYGNGKSHLAAACARHVLDRRGTAVFENMPRLHYRINASYGPDARETEDGIINALIDADLLVLDDLGANKDSEKTEERLYAIVDGRYALNKPIIATTNCKNLGELAERTGERTYSRILDMCLIVENTASDYRIERARKRARGA